MDTNATDINDTIFDTLSPALQDPAWLLNDIEEMKHSHHISSHTIEVSRQRTARLERKTSLRLSQYKNFQKEKRHSAVASGLLPPSKREDLRLPPLDLVNLFDYDVPKQHDTTTIITKMKERELKNRKNKEKYMIKSLSGSTGLRCKAVTRPSSPTGLEACTSAFRLPVGRPLPRPNTAPNIRDQRYAKDDRVVKAVVRQPLSRQVSLMAQNNLHHSVVLKLLSFIAITSYLKKLRNIYIFCKANTLRKHASARKLSRWWSVCLKKREHHRSVLRSQVPEVFTRFFYRYRRRVASNRITTFLFEFSKVKSTTVVRKFMMCVRKAQRFVRSCLEIKRARQTAVYAFWRKIEIVVRKQIADSERESRQRNRKLRPRRLLVHPGRGNYIAKKWKETSDQVNDLLCHLDGVQYELKQMARISTKESSAISCLDDESVEKCLVDEIIDAYIHHKRRIHLENVKTKHDKLLDKKRCNIYIFELYTY